MKMFKKQSKQTFKKLSEKGKDLYGRGQRVYKEFERQQAISKAKELQRLRSDRIKLEGQLRLAKLKAVEQERILKAKMQLGKGTEKKESYGLSL